MHAEQMPKYHFFSSWLIAAPQEAVWDAIVDSARWPMWWQGVLKVSEVPPGAVNGIDNVRRYAWRSVLPYTLEFEMRALEIKPFSELQGAASGEVQGMGCWTFHFNQGTTLVTYEWNVRTTGKWVNIIAPFFSRVVRWNHDVIMNWGAQGLASLLNAELLEVKNF